MIFPIRATIATIKKYVKTMYALTLKNSGSIGKVIAPTANEVLSPITKFNMLSATFLEGVTAAKSLIIDAIF